MKKLLKNKLHLKTGKFNNFFIITKPHNSKKIAFSQ